MILKRLKLKNYKIHKDLTVDFTGNLVGVIGPNGSGKSNLLGAIQFALSGEQPGFLREDLLCWGKDEGSVELKLRHAGEDVTIKRALHKNTAYIKVGDGECRGITKVREKIESFLGIDRDLIKQSIFARQAEIDSVLFADPRERELAFQRLCGIGDASRVHRVLGEYTSALDNTPDYKPQISEAEMRLSELQSRADTLKLSIDKITEQLSTLRDVQDLESHIQDLFTLRTLVDSLQTMHSSITQTEQGLAAAQAELATCVGEAQEDVPALNTQIEAKQQLIVQVQTFQQAKNAWESAGKQLMQLMENKPVSPEVPFSEQQLAEFDEQCAELKAQCTNHTQQLKTYQDLANALGSMHNQCVKCPVCGNDKMDADYLQSSITTLRAKTEQLVNSFTAADDKCNSARKQVNTILRTYESAMVKYEAEYKSLMAAYTSQEKAMTAVKVNENFDIATLNAQITELKARRDKSMQISSTRAGLEQKVNIYKQQLLDQKSKLDTANNNALVLANARHIEADLSTPEVCNVIEKSRIDMQSYRQGVLETQQQLSELRGVHRGVTESITQLNSTLDTLRDKQSKLANLDEARTVINNVRNWFHYNNGPKSVSTRVIRSMNTKINEFLGYLSAPFTVQSTDDGVNFNCIFHDGRPVPANGLVAATHLSGGQRMKLAIAFRFAGYCTFANKLGLLSLDEPTTYLDDDSVLHFCALLPRLKEVAKAMDLQIMMGTHARDVLPHMDTIQSFYTD